MRIEDLFVNWRVCFRPQCTAEKPEQLNSHRIQQDLIVHPPPTNKNWQCESSNLQHVRYSSQKSASLKHEIHDFLETVKIQHSKCDTQRKKNPFTPARSAKAFKSKWTKSVLLTYGTQKYNQVSYFVQLWAFKSGSDIFCRIFTNHIHREHLRHLILQYHLFAYNWGYDAQLRSKA